MDRSDLYIVPSKSELAALARRYASMSKTLSESEDAADRAAAPAYDLAFEAWRAMHDGELSAPEALITLQADAREQGLDPGLVGAVVEEMERVLLRGYKDTVGMVPGASAAATPPADAGPEPRPSDDGD
jgi:hypothetical protein